MISDTINGPRLDPNADPDADHDPRPEDETPVLDPPAAGGPETVIDGRVTDPNISNSDPELDDVAVGAPSGQQTSDRATGMTALP